MTNELVFDRYGPINERRKEFLGVLLPGLARECQLRTALDVGCGVGFFSQFLVELGFEVASCDARPENVAEAKRRYPGVAFHVRDVEDPGVLALGPVDMTLCFGLLYHLENPFRAIRNIHALTSKVAVVESMVAPHDLPLAIMVDEARHEDQSLRHVAFVPSEACLVKMLYRAGFGVVYTVQRLPEHEEFRESFGVRRRRTVLVASRMGLGSASLRPLPEPLADRVWEKRWGRPVERIAHFMGERLSRRIVGG